MNPQSQQTRQPAIAAVAPTSSPPLLSRHAFTALALLAMSVVIAMSRMHTYAEPFERDIATVILMGRELASGARMYVDVVEFKPPGAFVIWQLVHQAFGTSPFVVGNLTAVVAILTLYGVYWGAAALPWGRRAGLWAAAVWMLVGGDLYLEANKPNIEVFINVFLVWGFAFWARAAIVPRPWWRLLLAGIFLCLATLQKHHLTVVVLAMAVAWIAAARRDAQARRCALRQVAMILGSFAIIWATVAAYFALTGRWGPFWGQLVTYALFYAHSQAASTAQSGQGPLMHIFQGLMPARLLPSFAGVLLPTIALAIAGWYYAGRTRFQPAWLALGWLAGTFPVVAMPGTFYPHYYQLYLPPVAIAVGWGICALRDLGGGRCANLIGAAALLTTALYAAPQYAQSPDNWSVLKYRTHLFVQIRTLAESINNLLYPEETFYMVGVDPGLYYYSHRRPPSGILWVHRLLYGPFAELWTRKVIDDLSAARPALVAMGTYDFEMPIHHPLLHWIRAHYRPLKQQPSPLFIFLERKDLSLESRNAPQSPASSAQTRPAAGHAPSRELNETN